MKFDSSALPLLPTQQELTELNDLLLSAMELYQTYVTLERHPRVTGSSKSVELFTSCREQLYQDISLLDKQLETLMTLSHAKSGDGDDKSGEERATFTQTGGTEEPHPFLLLPDFEPTHIKQSISALVRKSF